MSQIKPMKVTTRILSGIECPMPFENPQMGDLVYMPSITAKDLFQAELFGMALANQMHKIGMIFDNREDAIATTHAVLKNVARGLVK